MRAGLSRVTITPDHLTEMGGYVARVGPSLGTHDPLYCRALVLEENGTAAALVECDCLGLGLDYTRQVKNRVERATGIPASNVILAATHTHSGPASVFTYGCGALALDWLGWLPDQILSAVQLAKERLVASRVMTGSVGVPGVAINRRDPEAGALDEELIVVWFVGEHGQTIGSLLNFACHAVVMDAENRLYSADFPGAFCASVEEATGSPSVFLQGPCGNINPARRFTFEAVDRMGSALGKAAISTLASAREVDTLELEVGSRPLSLALLPPPDYDTLLLYLSEQIYLARAVPNDGDQRPIRTHRAMAAWAERTLADCCSGRLQTHVDTELQWLRLGDLVLTAVPGELFVEYGIAAKQLAGGRGRQAVVIAYANGDIGYIPTASAYAQAAYEVAWAFKYYGYPGALSPEAGQAIADALSEAIAS